MDKRSNVLVIVLFVLIVIGMFAFAYLKSNELQAPSQVDEVPKGEEEESPLVTADRITATHYYTDGAHTFAGQIDMPTPCDLLTVETAVAESYPEQLTLNFKVVNNSESCAAVITPQRFLTTSVTASAEATIKATWNGKPIELNLIPALPGERPEEYELYQKG